MRNTTMTEVVSMSVADFDAWLAEFREYALKTCSEKDVKDEKIRIGCSDDILLNISSEQYPRFEKDFILWRNQSHDTASLIKGLNINPKFGMTWIDDDVNECREINISIR